MAEKKNDSYISRMTKRVDGWFNLMTGLGVRGRDKKMSTVVNWDYFPQAEAEALYAGDDIAEKIVEQVVDDSMAKEPIFTMSSLEENEEKVEFQKKLEDKLFAHDLYNKIKQAWIWGRLYGGAVILLGIDDGREPDEPVDWKNIKKLDWACVLHRHDLTWHTIQKDVSKKNFRLPLAYSLYQYEGVDGSVIHSDRMIRFDGANLPEELFRTNNYWHDSVLNRLQQVIAGYSSAFESVSTILNDFTQGVYKMKGLAKLMAEGDESQILKRMSLVDAKRSVVKAIVIDADNEDFSRETVNLTGVDKILDKMGQRLTAASKMPHTKLLGEGATGSLSGAGESENKDWSQYVKGQQKSNLHPAYAYLLKIFFAEKEGEFKGQEPEGWDIEFQPLHESTDAEKSDIRLKTSQADALDITNGVLTPEEVSMSRFGHGKYRLETDLVDKRDIEIEPNGNVKTDPDDEDGEESAQEKEQGQV